MAVYLISSFDIEKPTVFEGYVPAVLPLLEKHGAKIIVADYAARPFEGEKRGVNVVIKFETEASANAFYHDPEYQPAKNVRLSSASNGTVVLAKGFTASS